MRNIYLTLGILSIALLGRVEESKAQWMSEFSYGPSFSAREFQDFVPGTSWWNWEFQTRKVINNRYEVGGAFSWHYFEHDFGRRTTVGEGFALTANTTAYSNVLNFKFVNQYNLLENGSSIPFLRLGLGLGHQSQQQDVGLYTVGDNTWQFVLNPELGVRMELNYYLGLTITGGYTFMPESSGVLPTSFWSLKFGLSWLRF